MTKCSTYCLQILYYKPTFIRSDSILRFTRNILIRLDFFLWHISARDVHPIFKQRLHILHYKAFKIVWFTHLHVHLKEIDKPIHKKTSFILSVIWVRNVVFEVSVRKVAILRPAYCLKIFSVVNLISNKSKNISSSFIILSKFHRIQNYDHLLSTFSCLATLKGIKGCSDYKLQRLEQVYLTSECCSAVKIKIPSYLASFLQLLAFLLLAIGSIS